MKYLVLESIQRRPYIKSKFLEVLLEIIVLKVLEKFWKVFQAQIFVMESRLFGVVKLYQKIQ